MTVYPLKHADAEMTATLLSDCSSARRPAPRRAAPAGPRRRPARAAVQQHDGGHRHGAAAERDHRRGRPHQQHASLTGPAEVVAGVEDLITRLDLADEQSKQRRSEVYALHNASAADVANAINTFFSNQLAIDVPRRGINSTPIQDCSSRCSSCPSRSPTSCSSAPRRSTSTTIMRLITELDAEPPQVVIQVLIAEVDLTDDRGVRRRARPAKPGAVQAQHHPARPPARHGDVHQPARRRAILAATAVTVSSTIPATSAGLQLQQRQLACRWATTRRSSPAIGRLPGAGQPRRRPGVADAAASAASCSRRPATPSTC